MERIVPNLERVRRDVTRLSEFVSSEEQGYTRISFSEEDRQAREYLSRLMRDEAELSVRIDAAGNLIGRREGTMQKPAIMVGSHIDTVRGGGRLDGVSGVIAGIEVVRRLKEEGIDAIRPFEVVIFLAEEPSPFGISTIGSRAMAGRLTPDLLSSLRDDQGRTLGSAIDEMGGNSAGINEARRSPEDTFVFLELHIEQGPLLFSQGIPVGVVTGIVGISRGKIEVIGRNDHAGTPPMRERKDALVAGSELVLAFEKVCASMDGVVGTIGRVEVSPNFPNVVPGKMTLGLEARSLSEDLLNEITFLFGKELDEIRERRGIRIHFEMGISSRPVIFRPDLTQRIKQVCERLGVACAELPSGAGHDASHLAEIVPTGMIFVPSKDGRSHCPEEWTEFKDICLGIEVLASTITSLDEEEAS